MDPGFLVSPAMSSSFLTTETPGKPPGKILYSNKIFLKIKYKVFKDVHQISKKSFSDFRT